MLPRRTPGRVALAALGAVTVAHLVAQVADAEGFANLTQWFLMPLLAVVLVAESSTPWPRLTRLTLLALGLSWLGDTAPDLAEGDTAFLVMVGFFLLAQLAYLAAFAPYAARSVLRTRRWVLVAYVAAVVGLVAACAGGADDLLVPVLVYGVCLGAMAVLATGVNGWTAWGGALFLVSDGLIALGAFAEGFDLPAEGFWVMATYVAAQALIVSGVLRDQDR